MNHTFLKILDEYTQITSLMASGENVDLATLGRRQVELLPLVEKIQHLQKLEQEKEQNEELLNSTDTEMKNLAAEDIKQIETKILELVDSITEDLLPKDPNDHNNCIIEIRAGAGGDESTIFGAEMFRAYSKYADQKKYKIYIVSASRSEIDGFKEIIFEITGKPNQESGPYGTFKYESGVHRVQRVPETEKSGRVHTSTITIAVMPELEEKDFTLDPKDLKIEATTSSGHGGQSVNTTYSAIRITHLPTGITAQCQDERSQTQNKEKAMAVIRARVAAHYREIEEKKVKDARKSQIGTGDRSEKIRTYNFPQDRVTDHRINENFNQINLIMEGELEPIIYSLKKAEIELKKANLTN